MSSHGITRISVTALTALLFTLPPVASAQEPAAPVKAAPACIAVMAASVTGVDGNAAEAGDALRDLMISFLTGPSMEPVALEARVRPLALEEAKQKGCAYFITTTAARKRGGGGGGFGRVLGQAAETASCGTSPVDPAVPRSAAR